MAIIPKNNSINEIMEEGSVPMDYRDYLGYSSLGDPCLRKIWYSFRWAYNKEFPLRIKRIFDRGDMEEDRVIRDLARKGCVVSDIEYEVIGITGHAKGHIDGKAIGVPTATKTQHLFENKTMKASSYKSYINIGLKRYSPTYWQQIQSYMGHTKLDRCLYVVTNKDTEERDYKRIPFDLEQFKEGERKAFAIITSENPPDRLPNANRTFYTCKMCDARKQCLYDEPIKVTCRTCINCDFEDEGVIRCSLNKMQLGPKSQLQACEKYEIENYTN